MYFYAEKKIIFRPCLFPENNSSLSGARLYDIVYISRKINRGTKLTLSKPAVKCRSKIPRAIRETLPSPQSELVARIAERDVINV